MFLFFPSKIFKWKLFKVFIIIILFIIEIIIYKSIYLSNLKLIKVCLCTIGKKENKYASEYVEYYKNYGVDKIFIYDNNDINGELFENVLSDYISKGFVEIINYRGLLHPQLKMLNDCYNKNYQKYDWFIMFDMDEYINLKNYTNIKNYLNSGKFKNCQVIYFSRAFHTDNNQIYYRNRSLFERFPKSIYNVFSVKPILRGHIINAKINDNHLINKQYQRCYSFGQKYIKNYDFKNYFIEHFYFKSTEEFIEKMIKGDVYYNNTFDIQRNKLLYYLNSNNMTKEKINYKKKKTGIKLSDFKNITMNKK